MQSNELENGYIATLTGLVDIHSSRPNYRNLHREETHDRNTWRSTVRGVYPVIRKWHLGVGINDARRPTKSLFIYPGYRRVVVLADITVETSEFVWEKVGFERWRRSTAILFNAVLSRTTTQSAFCVKRLRVNRELYGCTTTSLVSIWLGNTL